MAIPKNTFLIPTICRIRFVFSSVVTTTRKPLGHLIEIGNIPPATWDEIYFTPGTAVFTEVQKEEDPGQLYTQTLKFLFPGEALTNATAFDELLNRPLLIAMFSTNSMTKILGTSDNPARMSKSLKTDERGTTWEFTVVCFDKDQAYSYVSS
ncbi:MAG: hypothetical protein WCL00_12400 [Bacteroidota bacterium]